MDLVFIRSVNLTEKTTLLLGNYPGHVGLPVSGVELYVTLDPYVPL